MCGMLSNTFRFSKRIGITKKTRKMNDFFIFFNTIQLDNKQIINCQLKTVLMILSHELIALEDSTTKPHTTECAALARVPVVLFHSLGAEKIMQLTHPLPFNCFFFNSYSHCVLLVGCQKIASLLDLSICNGLWYDKYKSIHSVMVINSFLPGHI